MTQTELDEILEKHKHWINEDCEDWEDMRADLQGADLQGADLQGADLWCANLNEKTQINFPIACPDTGSFTAWKKARIRTDDGVMAGIVQLEIPADARRSSATSRKCRCDKAKVLRITSLDGATEFDEATSQHDSGLVYKVGETVTVPNFDENRWNECSTGIHFFITRQEAIDY